MEQKFCKYHPLAAARWQCNTCQLELCQECVGPQESSPECAICLIPMQRLKVQNLSEPFWQRISSFFMFPASFPTVMYLGVLATLSSFVSLEPMGLLVGFIVYYFFINFSYTVLEFSARGHLQQLHTSTTGFLFRPESIIKQLLIILLLAGVNLLVIDVWGISAFYLSVVIILYFFPAVVVQLIKHNNPLKIFSFREALNSIKLMGKTYWLLWLSSIMLVVSASLSLQIVPLSPNEYLNLAIDHMVIFYFILVMFSMLGYGLHQYYEKLELGVDADDADKNGCEAGTSNIRKKRADILIKEGYLEDAGKSILEIIETTPADLSSWQRYFKILILQGRYEELNGFAQEYVNYLLHQEKDMEAMEVYLDAQRVIAGFRPKTGVQAFTLANRLRAHGHAGLALNLLNNMHKHYRGYEGIAKAYMLAAQILCEQFGEDVKARKILNFIIRKYPQSISSREATDYLKVVDRLAVR